MSETQRIAEPVLHMHTTAPSATILPEASDGFVHTERVDGTITRAMAYIASGYPVHLAGPAGTGKTTLAFHIAALRGRPVSLIHGNDSFGGGDLVGRDTGYRRSSTVDNYIHSVLKTEESLDVNWTDNRLTTACKNGHTLIYDEFNRTRAEANNTLLSILEEGILATPRAGAGYIRVHPEFRLILTSNPVEYAGVHRTQDALLDRLITIRCGHYDAKTEAEIVAAATDCDPSAATRIVSLVRTLRGEQENAPRPTIRAAIALARVTREAGVEVDARDEVFAAIAWDILGEDAETVLSDGEPLGEDAFRAFIEKTISRSRNTRSQRKRAA